MGLLKHIKTTEQSDKELNRQQIERYKNLLYEKLGYKGMLELSTKGEEIARSEIAISLRSLINIHGDAHNNSELLIEAISDEILGLGPLESLLKDDEISEIMVNGLSSMFYEKRGKLYEMQQVFISDEQIRVLIDRIISPLGRRLDEQRDRKSVV